MVFQLDEPVAFPHGLAGFEADFCDDAGKVCSDGDSLNGFQGADGPEGGLPRLGLHHQGGDGGWWRGEGFAHGDGGLDLAEFGVADAGDGQQDAQEHQKHSFDHKGRERVGVGWLSAAGVWFLRGVFPEALLDFLEELDELGVFFRGKGGEEGGHVPEVLWEH